LIHPKKAGFRISGTGDPCMEELNASIHCISARSYGLMTVSDRQGRIAGIVYKVIYLT
jgi:hypothetical protein